MTPQSEPSPADILAGFAKDSLHALLATILIRDDASPEEKQNRWNVALVGLRPRDTMEAMLATQVIAAHHAVMDNYRQAMLPGISPQFILRFRANAAAHAKIMRTTAHELAELQAGALPDNPTNAPMPFPSTVSDFSARPASAEPSAPPGHPAIASPPEMQKPMQPEPIPPAAPGPQPPEPSDGRIATTGPKAPPGTRRQDMTMAERRAEFGYRYPPEFADAVAAMDAADPIARARAAARLGLPEAGEIPA